MNSHPTAEVDASVRLEDFLELRQAILRYCLSLTGSKWEAEDLVQDICLKFLPSITGTAGLETTEAYLFRAARNKWIDKIRRNKVHERAVAGMKHDQDTNPAEEPDSVEVASAMTLVLTCLSPLQRCVFLLRDVLGYTAPEVARKLEMTEGAVKSVLYRARTTLALQRRDWNITTEESLRDHDQFKAELQQYLQALSTEDADLLIQMMHNDVADPAVAVNRFRMRSNRHRLASDKDVRAIYTSYQGFFCRAAA